MWSPSSAGGVAPVRPRPARRVAAVLLALGVWLAAGAGTASAHATLVSTDPPDGVTLGTAPAVIRMVFSEPVAVDLVTVDLVDDQGRAAAGVSLAADPADDAAVLVHLPALGPGAYHLAWRAVDDVDLHVTTGTLVFGLTVAAPATVGATATTPAAGEVVLRWLDLVALALVAGVMALLALAVPRPEQPPLDTRLVPEGQVRRRLLRVALVAAPAAALTGTALLAIQALGTGGTLVAVLATAYGTAWLVRLAVLAAILVLVAAQLDTHAPGRAGDLAGVVLVGGLAGLQAITGHVAEGAPAEQPVRVVALAGHVLAAWSWSGGLALLVLAVLPMRRRGPAHAAVAMAVLGRFWRVATPSLALVAVSGIYLAGQFVATPAALGGSLYGQALMVKIGLASIAAFLGLLNAAALHRVLATGLARWRLPVARVAGRLGHPRRVTLEAVGALAVVVGASVMAASPPARGPAWDPAPAVADQAPVAVKVDDLMVLVSVRPNRPGPNFVDLTVYQTRKPAPAPIGQVLVGLAAPAGDPGALRAASPLDATRFELADAISTAGGWQVAVAVRRPGLPDVRTTVPWTILPAAPAVAGPDGIGGLPLAPAATLAALLLAFAIAAATVVAVIRRVAPARTVTALAPQLGAEPGRSSS